MDFNNINNNQYINSTDNLVQTNQAQNYNAAFNIFVPSTSQEQNSNAQDLIDFNFDQSIYQDCLPPFNETFLTPNRGRGGRRPGRPPIHRPGPGRPPPPRNKLEQQLAENNWLKQQISQKESAIRLYKHRVRQEYLRRGIDPEPFMPKLFTNQPVLPSPVQLPPPPPQSPCYSRPGHPINPTLLSYNQTIPVTTVSATVSQQNYQGKINYLDGQQLLQPQYCLVTETGEPIAGSSGLVNLKPYSNVTQMPIQYPPHRVDPASLLQPASQVERYPTQPYNDNNFN